ncbi:hypothetical protein B0T16DRAFT_501373 [Cercophora newfieldiana]|uniref:Uncharacterized protein n=1 Tax=Cercophora newfieldiana TaxID=92897 RepID=A0AA39YQB3_9PEZI|nr:hypothetical protein B0T16DRAFT_501373 [Cercophora newfieldiana]
MLWLRISPARPAAAAALRGRLGAGVAKGRGAVARLSTLRRGGCISVALDPEVSSKQQVVDAVANALARSSGSEQGSDAALILASKSLASWLQDATFVSQILAPLSQSQSPAELSVLSAAVDGIPRVSSTGSYSSSDGLAILYGSLDTTLPGLWTNMALKSKGDVSSSQPSLEFHVAPLEEDSRPLQVTVPVANTVFNNGRPHTMFASRWRTAKGSLPGLLSVVEKTRQVVVAGNTSSSSSTVVAPLVPLTEARKILAGLGNILRQVEIDLLPAPASKELEDIIPKLLKARSERCGGRPVGPMEVWALIYPEHVAASQGLPRALGLDADESHEWSRAQEVSRLMPGLLASGCHIRKILSGGGGWGLKQGLLSLDPQTKYSTPDEEDIESFIRSFNGEDSGGATVIPGSYVQFMVEPFGHPPKGALQHDTTDGASMVLGAQGAASEQESLSEYQVQQGLFGAISSEGIYIASGADASQAGEDHGITTKLDASGSWYPVVLVFCTTAP